MPNFYLDPRSMLTMMCVSGAICFWNNDAVFYAFGLLAVIVSEAKYLD